MPPVRWKSFAALCLVYLMVCTDAQTMQDAISMTSDGWRPILGTSTRREPVYHDEILHYRNPSQTGGESIKAETYPPPTTTQAPPTTTPPAPTTPPPPQPKPSRALMKPTLSLQAGKIPPHSKPPVSHYFALPNLGLHGPHIPLGSVTHGRPGQIGMIKKFPTPTKPFIHQMNHINGKRHIKPVRIQPSANSHRDEIFAASPSSGGYAFFKPGPNNIKTRETVGLGLPGGAHYSVSQPHAHIEFTNRFALPPASENIFQPFSNPLQGFIFPKHAQSNDVNYQFQNQNDEYTRNLVPPPPLLYRDKNDIKAKDDLSVKPRPSSENVVLQVPPTFEFQRQKASTKAPVQVQVTKEKLNVFHNNVPSNYNGDYVDYDFHSVRNSNPPSNAQMYEVTEGKPWHDLLPQFSPRPRKPPPKKIRPLEVQLNLPPFLPTPYRPEGQGIVPTSPTQSEVSTIFTKLSKLQQDKAAYTTAHPFTFDVKEVSTHYPILGKPSFDYETQTPYVMPLHEISNDITTKHQKESDIITTPEPPIRHRPSRRRKPSHRLRITTTEAPAETDGSYMEDVSASDSVETERPVSQEHRQFHRHRKPSRYRTTTPPSSTESEEIPAKTRGRNRYRTRPPANDLEQPRKRMRPIKHEIYTEIPENHKMVEDSSTDMSSIEDESASVEAEIQKDVEQEVHYIPEEDANKFEEVPKQSIDRSEEVIPSTTERQPTTILHLPENEIDSPSKPFTEQEETTITTTTEGTTTTPKRIRGRPIKYDNANRPRFSVKEFRQKLSTSTEPSTKVSTENPRIRFPNRLRRPLSGSTTASPTEEDNNTERAKFVPKDPRHSTDTENDTITEKNVKSVNSRLRPFSRYRSTTVSTAATPKLSIKTNLFARRRPPTISLRSKIFNKYNKNNTDDKTTTVKDEEETTIPYNQNIEDDSPTTKKIKEEVTEETETTTADIMKNESYIYSQRVSDLTSSSKNEYNTPGLFKSVSPTSRRIPPYFTIATDDPILPIEAFFPNIKDKPKE